MAALTQARKTKIFRTGKFPIKGFTQKAGTVIFKGGMAMHVAGVFQPAASGVASSVYAGIAVRTYDCSARLTDYTWPTDQPMEFERDAAAFAGKSGDLPTDSNLGGLVYVSSDNEVKATMASNDVSLYLLSQDGVNFIVVP